MSDTPEHDDVVVESARSNPFAQAAGRFGDWLGNNGPSDRKIILGLGGALVGALVTIAVLATRAPEIQPVAVTAPTPGTKIVQVPIKAGETVLGIAVNRYNMEPMAALGLNRELLLANTKRCDDAGKTKGACRREDIAGYKLALDAAWPGQIVLVEVPADAPTLASTAK